jgi:type 2 lantibiotic biosynthesis protein LanM
MFDPASPLISPLASNAVGTSLPAPVLAIKDTLLNEAEALGAKLERMSFALPGGGLAWPTPDQPEGWQRAAIKDCEYDLYSGICGIAVFLAALEKITNASRYRSLAKAALRPLCELSSVEIDGWLARSGMGAGTGALSVIYSLLKTAEFLNDQELLEASFRIARRVPEERLTRSKMVDLMAGTAGYALVWTALYKVAPEPWVLERAALCGEHLLRLRTVTAAGFRAWETSTGIYAAGYAHGAAGIVSALCKVFEITGDQRFQDAADEARTYENTLYNQTEENWPHLLMPDGQGGFEYWNSWCSGAPGIGIGRLNSTARLGQYQLKEDIDRVLRTAAKSGRFGHIDFPCCGTLGRVELFLQAARHPGREHYHVHALQLADAVVRRSIRKGAYGYGRDSNNPPLTFHKGMAGIGYQLLRTACPELLPSILSWE